MTARPAPLPNSTDYAGYAEWKAWDAGSFMAPSPAERSYYANELRGHRIAGKPVLELGFGNGGFLAWAKDQGAVVHGTELQPDLAARGAAAGVVVEPEDIAALLPAARARFALVAAFDVFEHLDIAALPGLLATTAELLEDGGLLVARYPNGQSPFGRVHQHGDMTHRTVLSADIMRQLVAGLPFDPVHLGNPARPAGGVEQARRLIHRTIEIALQRLYGHDTPLAPNSVAILRRRARSTAHPYIQTQDRRV
ncbi:methyltransferase domain-containing protein [Sphingomonas sp.]|uniref:methyltransferase domain-containing protein n=1 Tax=Sphingomonas sp. TaxID=28214 RepID=UPI003750833E